MHTLFRSLRNMADIATKQPVKIDTLSSQTERFILDFIKQNRLIPGDTIPSEKQISEQLGISRAIVREAYKGLSAKGIITVKSGHRPKISKFNPEALQYIFMYTTLTEQISIQDILSVRSFIEIGGVGDAAEKATTEDIINLGTEMIYIEKYINDPDNFVEHDINFHIALAKATYNPLYIILLQALRQYSIKSSIEGIKLQSKEPGNDKRIIQLHQEIYESVKAHDRSAATQAMINHFSTVNSAFKNNMVHSL